MAQERRIGYDDTPFLPGGRWRVHDGARPQPRLVSPGAAGSGTEAGRPPSDAVVLFDGTDLSGWETTDGGEAKWKVERGHMEVAPRTGSIRTKERFGDCQLHVEWATPEEVKGEGQGRGNSGVFLMGLYEIQVLDSSGNPTYADGSAAAVYGQHPPLVNASRGPGEWQTYDIIWLAPRFEGEKLVSPARLTLLHNGVVVHAHRELIGRTGHKVVGAYSPHPPEGPLMLQDHGDPVRYRNIWYRPLADYDSE
jgi:hypothetical protein